MDLIAEDEVDKNYVVFQRELPKLLKQCAGKFVMMHDAAIVETYDSATSAFLAGFARFGEGGFSVQEVTDQADDLGFYSHAGVAGQA